MGHTPRSLRKLHMGLDLHNIEHIERYSLRLVLDYWRLAPPGLQGS